MTTLSNLFKTGLIGADYVKVSDVKAYNANGGSFTSGAWRTRDINIEDSDASSICSISTNQITLEAGTYICNIRPPAYYVGGHQTRLYNITDSETTLTGASSFTNEASGNSNNIAAIKGTFTIASQKTFEVQHYCQTTKTINGFGVCVNVSGLSSIYTTAEFWRVKDLSEAFSEVADYVKVTDHKAYNADGGTFTQDAWQTRDINTEDFDDSNICSISSNQITLDAGTYICQIKCPAFSVYKHIARLYNISDSEEVLNSTTERASVSDDSVTSAWIVGKFTISTQKTFEVQHRCGQTQSTAGFGKQSNVSGYDSIYTTAEFWRVAT